MISLPCARFLAHGKRETHGKLVVSRSDAQACKLWLTCLRDGGKRGVVVTRGRLHKSSSFSSERVAPLSSKQRAWCFQSERSPTMIKRRVLVERVVPLKHLALRDFQMLQRIPVMTMERLTLAIYIDFNKAKATEQ